MKTIETISELTRSVQILYRKHQRGPTISQNNFSNHFVNIHVCTQAKGTPEREPRTNLISSPSLGITHTGTIETSRLEHPPTSDKSALGPKEVPS